MTISQVSAKIDLRLNRSASGDYDNLWPYVKQEAFTKAINDWVRRQKHGKNVTQEGDEESDMRVDDLQVLLKEKSVRVRNKERYSETEALPDDYLYFKRFSPSVSKGKCQNVRIKSHLKEEANVDDLLTSSSFDFEETYHTIIGNKIHLYHNGEFTVDSATLTYYRKPKTYLFSKLNTVVEFKDDICELLVDEACKIIASDLENGNQKQLAQEREKENN